MAEASPRHRRSVVGRVLLAYALVAAAFAIVTGWGVIAQRNAARDADLMRSGYLPLSLALRDLVANQDTWNTQLNHITTAGNPADVRLWFETTRRLGRPKLFGEVRAAITRAFGSSDDPSVSRWGSQLLSETSSIENFLAADRELLEKLFVTLDRGDTVRAESLRTELVTRGSQGKLRLSALEERVQARLDALLDDARARERLAIRLLVGLGILALLIFIVMAVYTRRVLKPLGAVTERAKAVARGDLTPQPVVASPDEIGELATTFENMVRAIASANEQLIATERLATIGKMAAHVTHEIRNPLSSMALNVELLEEELSGTDNAEAHALLRAVKNEIERLTGLSGQYLSVARQKPTQIEDEDVVLLVREAVDFMRGDLRRHGVEVEVVADETAPSVRVDEAQLKQALFNLLRNAREAMPSGGRVEIGVSAAAGGGVDIVVDDAGEGIDEETRGRLFEPFFTTKGHGTGLGLAITRQIIEAHAGTIACEPLKPKGTRFWIHLPDASRSSQPGDPARDSADDLPREAVPRSRDGSP